MIGFLRWTAILLLTLVLVVWLGVGKLGWRAYAALPKTEGEIAAPGLDAEGSIVRDARGVPHIYAETDHDAAFLTGFAHAQDRLWQMHVTRWYLRGQMAGILGAAAAGSDHEMRVFALGPAADALAANMTEAELAPLEAYAAGVNAALASDGFVPPLEFLMVGASPAEWTAADCLLIYKGLGLDLIDGSVFREPSRERLRAAIGEARLQEFLPAYPDYGPIALTADEMGLVSPESAPSEAIGEDADAAPASDEPETEGAPDGDPPEGSNNWVVSGARTVTGLPLLANDPHLSLRTPSVWYLAAIHAPDSVAVGGTIPGAPHVILGRNGDVAWGMTNTATDAADLVFQPESAVTDTWEETIPVRFGQDRTITLRRTADGAVLPAGVFAQGDLAPEGQVAVLRWTLDDPDDRTATVGAALNRVRNWEDFQTAISDFHVPMQNIVFAGADGDIGITLPGYAPIRDADGNWTGPIPIDEWPRALNPEDGVIVTANNRITPSEYPYTLTEVWAEPWRAQRITDLLAETDAHTKQSFAAVQTDAVDISARLILPAIIGAKPATEAGQESLAMLIGWDGDMDAGAPEPLIYSAWMKALSRAVYEDELGEAFAVGFAMRPQFMLSVLTGEAAGWCDDTETEAVDTCIDIAGPALDAAAADLQSAHGGSIADWRWGEAHEAYLPHAPFALFPVLDGIFSGRIAAPGNGATVNVGGHSYRQDAFTTSHGASYRAIYDLSNLDSSLFAMPMGQSGHLASPHYRDLLEPWAQGEYFTIPADWTPETSPPGAQSLRLTPAN